MRRNDAKNEALSRCAPKAALGGFWGAIFFSAVLANDGNADVAHFNAFFDEQVSIPAPLRGATRATSRPPHSWNDFYSHTREGCDVLCCAWQALLSVSWNWAVFDTWYFIGLQVQHLIFPREG